MKSSSRVVHGMDVHRQGNILQAEGSAGVRKTEMRIIFFSIKLFQLSLLWSPKLSDPTSGVFSGWGIYLALPERPNAPNWIPKYSQTPITGRPIT
jgi:hypothetical protein